MGRAREQTVEPCGCVWVPLMSNTGPIPWRLETVERQVTEQAATSKQLNQTLIDLQKTILDLDNRIKVHDLSRKFWSKIWLTVACSVAVGLIGFLVKISYIVQSARP